MNSKSIVKTMVLVLSFFAITSLALAGKGPGNPTQPPAKPAVCDNFVDSNGDGICDTCKNLAYQHQATQTGNGPVCGNFVDLNGDGICDNCDQFDCLHDGICDGTGPQGPRN
jgi:hypothetical protein